MTEMTHARRIEKVVDLPMSNRLNPKRFYESGCGSLSKAQPDPRWHCFQSHQQAERWAEFNLIRQGYETFVPLVTELRRDPVLHSLTRRVEVPCFPGYGFVRFDPIHDSWRPIVSTRGVRRLFCTGLERPIPVPRGQIERMIEEAGARRILSAELPAFAQGAELAVIAGPFADREGVCKWSSETRVSLLMQALGAEVVVELPRGAVRAK